MTRKIFMVFFSQSMVVMCTSAQWTALTSGITAELYSVHFPTYDTGYVVGDYGTILKTTDNGDHWVSLSTGLTVYFKGVYFTSAQTGYAVGDSGVIIKTTNGGSSWSILRRVDGWQPLYSVFFTDSLHGFVAGYDLPLLKTEDGGEHWNQPVISALHPLIETYKVHFPTPDTGYASYRSGVLKTTDAGNTWIQIVDNNSNSAFPFSILYGCHFTSSTTGYVAGWYSSALVKTTDGGDSWTILDDSVQLYSVFFPDPLTGYAVGVHVATNGERGSVFKTSDGGNSWEVQKIPQDGSPVSFQGVHFINGNCGFVVGWEGRIFRTRNGGATSLVSDQSLLPSSFELSQNFPNPFNPSTTIRFSVPKESFVSLKVYDLLGREAAVLVKGDLSAGSFDVQWNASDNVSGVYFYTLKAGDFISTKKLILLK